jgi:spore protease
MKNMRYTDLACEENAEKQQSYEIYTKELYGITTINFVSKESLITENVTLYTGKCWKYDKEYVSSVKNALSLCISSMVFHQGKGSSRILVAGLGNRSIKSDSLGPSVVDMLYPAVDKDKFENEIRLTCPGVEGQSGFSSFEMIKKASEMMDASLLIAIDSLCAIGTERLASTIQLSATGILPGSGIGNHKKEISKNTLGIPVISIGVPTVSNLGALTKDEELYGLYVSPNDIDFTIESMSQIISASILNSLYKLRKRE